jgi:hypothetical protein
VSDWRILVATAFIATAFIATTFDKSSMGALRGCKL